MLTGIALLLPLDAACGKCHAYATHAATNLDCREQFSRDSRVNRDIRPGFITPFLLAILLH